MGGRGASSMGSPRWDSSYSTNEGRRETQLKNNTYPGDNLKDYWLGGLNANRYSNKYLTMDRVSEDGNRIVVKVADSHLTETKYGYALILDKNHVVFLKSENVSRNFYGNEVVLNKQYFNVKEYGDFSDKFGEIKSNLSWEDWKKTAQSQKKAGTRVMWESHYKSPKQKAIMRHSKVLSV